MKEINLRDFYPWYMEDVMVEVTEEVAEELLAGQRYIKASRRRVYRNKAHFSLDAEDGIEYSACFSNPSPQELIERMERFEHICHALNSLPGPRRGEERKDSTLCRVLSFRGTMREMLAVNQLRKGGFNGTIRYLSE